MLIIESEPPKPSSGTVTIKISWDEARAIERALYYDDELIEGGVDLNYEAWDVFDDFLRDNDIPRSRARG